jgi:hypothetical protein
MAGRDRAQRRAAQEADARADEAAQAARVEAPVREVDPNPASWQSRCSGWRGGFHERARGEPDAPRWRCRWCWRWFDR